MKILKIVVLLLYMSAFYFSNSALADSSGLDALGPAFELTSGAVTSSVIWSVEKTSEDKHSQIEKEKEIFIATNYDLLLGDFSRGEGEYSQAYAILMGCPKTDAHLFGEFFQTQFSSLNAGSHPPTRIRQQIDDLALQNPSLVSKCGIK